MAIHFIFIGKLAIPSRLLFSLVTRSACSVIQGEVLDVFLAQTAIITCPQEHPVGVAPLSLYALPVIAAQRVGNLANSVNPTSEITLFSDDIRSIIKWISYFMQYKATNFINGRNNSTGDDIEVKMWRTISLQ